MFLEEYKLFQHYTDLWCIDLLVCQRCMDYGTDKHIYTHVHTQVHTHISQQLKEMETWIWKEQGSMVSLEGEKRRKKGYNFITISKMKIVSKNSFSSFYFMLFVLFFDLSSLFLTLLVVCCTFKVGLDLLRFST